MNDFGSKIYAAAQKAVKEVYDLDVAEGQLVVETPQDTKLGDYSTSIAMKLSRTLRRNPMEIAEPLVAKLAELLPECESITVARPGFINFKLKASALTAVINDVITAGDDYGKNESGKGKHLLLEWVSANPTGDLHCGHARNAAWGDCIARMMEASGWDVLREFYVNDFGNQIEKFAKSIEARYIQLIKGEDAIEFPEDGYHGDDIRELAKAFYDIHGDSYLEKSVEERHADMARFGLERNIPKMKSDLERYGIKFDEWFFESSLHNSGYVKDTVEELHKLGWTYEKEGALWLKTADIMREQYRKQGKKDEDIDKLDLKDDVLRRANGFYTYFAGDIAYHRNKFAVRHFDKVINVWGADHHGHVARMKGAMDAIGLHGEDLDVVLMQMVNLMRDGQPVRMSKRTGNAITLTDLLEEVPIDSARFLFNMHDAGSGIDFDLDQAVKTDNDNPVYYVQYAHARICSILKKMESEGVAFAGAEQVDATLLTDPSEMDLIRMLAAFPQEIVMAAEKYDPSRINRFVIDLASAFHRFYGNCRIQGADPAVQQARLALCIGVKNAIFNVLTMFKINVPEKM